MRLPSAVEDTAPISRKKCGNETGLFGRVIVTVSISSGTSLSLNIFSKFSCAATAAPAFYGDPPDEHHPWAVHDGNRPQPKIVTPGTFSSQAQPGQPPSDAIVLFNGTDLSQWVNKDGGPAKWLAKDGVMEVVPKSKDIQTKEQFGDCQLHIEWAEPNDIHGTMIAVEQADISLRLLANVRNRAVDLYREVMRMGS